MLVVVVWDGFPSSQVAVFGLIWIKDSIISANVEKSIDHNEHVTIGMWIEVGCADSCFDYAMDGGFTKNSRSFNSQ